MAKDQRVDEEKKESHEEIKNEAPGARFQNDQQVAPSTGFDVKAGETNFTPKRIKTPGSILKQDVAASVVKDASMGGSLSGDGASFAGMRSSGSVGGVLGAANATPVAGKARSDSRTSKKLDRNSTKLNFIPNDTILVEWDESKPLADAHALDQGFNGTYRNEYARAQKNREAVPGALMFDRSIDLLVKDNLYFGQGQKVTQTGVTTNDDLTRIAVENEAGIFKYPASAATVNYLGGATGNYLATSVDILFNEDGRPIYTVYNEENLECEVDQFVANKSSAQDHILRNDAELCREVMDAKAGDEKADIWTPLARAVDQPTQLVGFLRDIEAGVGNEVLTAYRKFCVSMSFQLNRAHKDGQDAVNPAILALEGLNYNFVSKAAQITALGSDIQDCFGRDKILNGHAGTMIALYDSVNKYTTKADLLIQPRSFRMHLQTADNNMNPLWASKLYDQAYSNQEVFSTIDREYDPMAPICMTDKAGVVHRISWHKMGSYVYNHMKLTVADKTTTTVTKFTLVPQPMVAEIKAAGKIIYFLYPHEAVGNIDNYSNGEISPDSGYEWANGKKAELLISDDIGFSTTHAYVAGEQTVYNNILYVANKAHVGSWDGDDFDKVAWGTVAQIDVFSIANNSINEDYPLVFNGNGSTSHKAAVSKIELHEDAVKLYAYQGGPAVYTYYDLRNNYVVTVHHPLTEGIEKYFTESIGAKYYSLIVKGGEYNAPVNIKTVHSAMYFSLWSILLCAAVPYIVKERINSFRDVLYYEKNVEYPFASTLVNIKDVLTKAYTNFGFTNYDTELDCNRMTPVTAIQWMLPELYQQVGYDSGNDESQVLMPWYTNQNEIRYINGSYIYDDDASAMSFPSIRSGVRFGPLDNLYGMTEKDVRLCLDKVASFKGLNPTLGRSHTYKYSTVGDGQMVLAIDPDDMSARNIMKLPRELGFVMTAPYGVLTPKYNHAFDLGASVLGTTSFRCYYWYGANPTVTDDNGTDGILKAISINVNRAQNFKQDWYCVLASGTIPAVDHGFYLSANQAFDQKGALLNGKTKFKPYTTLADDAYGSYTSNVCFMRSFQKYLWTRIQKLPFIISPFDGLAIDNSDSPNNVIVTDPYDLLYVFGLGGFRASDFRESVYNREKEVVNQGILFVSDPWINDSPIFKEGATTANVATSKGFELGK